MRISNLYRFTAICITFFTLLAYSNTFYASWHLDDYRLLNNEIEVRDAYKIIKSIPSYGRGVGDLTFAFNYAVGKFDPFGYHLLNIVIHLLCAFVLFVLVEILFKTPRGLKEGLEGEHSNIAFFTSLLFVIHPIQTQAVTYVIQRYSALVALFYFASLIFYISYRLSQKAGTWPYLTSLFFAFLALNVKQNALTLPIAILGIEFIFFERKEKKRKIWLSLLPFIAIALLIPARIIWWKFFNPAGGPMSAHYISVTETIRAAGSLESFFSRFHTLLYYLRYTLWPSGLSIHHGFTGIASVFHPAVIGAYIVAALVVGLALKAKVKYPVCSFGLLFFLLAPAVELFWPDRTLFYDHWAYLPSAGLILVFVYCVFLFSREKVSRKRISGLLMILAIILSIATYQRNSVWITGESLWRDAYEKNRENSFTLFQLGLVLLRAGNIDEGCGYAKKAYEMEPFEFPVLALMGNCHHIRKEYKLAEHYFKSAINISPQNVEVFTAYINLLAIYKAKGDREKAFVTVRKIMRLKKSSPVALNTLGLTYFHFGEYEKALELFLKNSRLFPRDAAAYKFAGVTLMKMGRKEKAGEIFKMSEGL